MLITGGQFGPKQGGQFALKQGGQFAPKRRGQYGRNFQLNEYFKNLEEAGMTKEQITSLHNEFKNQKITNVYYLPPNPINREEFIVFLDKVCWHPSEEFSKKLSKIEEERFISLANFGYYLLILKLSIHFCRVPEEVERTTAA